MELEKVTSNVNDFELGNATLQNYFKRLSKMCAKSKVRLTKDFGEMCYDLERKSREFDAQSQGLKS